MLFNCSTVFFIFAIRLLKLGQMEAEQKFWGWIAQPQILKPDFDTSVILAPKIIKYFTFWCIFYIKKAFMSQKYQIYDQKVNFFTHRAWSICCDSQLDINSKSWGATLLFPSSNMSIRQNHNLATVKCSQQLMLLTSGAKDKNCKSLDGRLWRVKL